MSTHTFALPALPAGSTTLHRAMVASTRREHEFVVFFEAPAAHRIEHIELLMSLAWNEAHENMDIYNICSERELLDEALGDRETGDLRLFEIGHSQGRPRYADPARTAFFVSPATATRLGAVQILLPQSIDAEALAA